MALTTTYINNIIAKAQRAQEVGMLSILHAKQRGKKVDSMYYPMRFLSAGVDVLNSSNGLTNLQIETIVYEMIEQGNLNDFSGDPIPYLTNLTIVYNGATGPAGPTGPPGPAGPSWTWQDAIIAAGNSQGSATAILNNINVISSVPVGTGVVLDAATVGKYRVLSNHDVVDLNVYPNGTDLFFGINPSTGLAYLASAPLILVGSNTVRLFCSFPGRWDIV